MKLKNCKLNEWVDKLGGKRLILFGGGNFFHDYVEPNFPETLIDNIAYFIDNGRVGEAVEAWGRVFHVYAPQQLKTEKQCVVMLLSIGYMNEMYLQIREMDLSDCVECYAYPLMLAVSYGETNKEIEKLAFDINRKNRIPKIIHSFWFSQEEKPQNYQQCIDTWKEVCPDYEIIEWNTENYDVGKHPFLKRAIELKKWAFAADYARLDMVYRLGGVYLDMDVELVKSLDCLLGNRAFFSFDLCNDVDLATFGSEKENPILKRMLELYDEIEFTGTAYNMNKLCQPLYIRPVLAERGLIFNGNLQMIDDMVFLPRQYCSPLEWVAYEQTEIFEETVAIHRFCSGWKDNEFRSKRLRNNRMLMKMVNPNG